jgi:hypothetical protein
VKDAKVSLAKVIIHVRNRQKSNEKALIQSEESNVLRARHRRDALKELADYLERNGESLV